MPWPANLGNEVPEVVLGGVHPSVLPEEAAQHADAVMVGEAEGFWQIIIEDASRNALKPIYYNYLPETMELPLVDYKKNKDWRIPALIPVIATRAVHTVVNFVRYREFTGAVSEKFQFSRFSSRCGAAKANILVF